MQGFRSIRTLLFLGLLSTVNAWAISPSAGAHQLAELTPSNSTPQDWFGLSIAISGDTVVVGAFDANIEPYGTVYVYVKPDNGWTNMTQVAKLTSSDNGDGFGTSVAISGNTVVVGAANTSNFLAPAATPGAAYVFVRPNGGWRDMTETAKLTASDGQAGDAFGDSVGISNDTIAVGAFFAPDHSGNSFAGKAYAFVRPAGGWSGSLHETAKLTASDSQLLNYMGGSVAIAGMTIVAGAWGHNNFEGAAYVFSMPQGGWADMTQTAELTASDGRASSNLGFSAAISGDTVVLGAPGASHFKGQAYVYDVPTGIWGNMTETAKLRASNATEGDSFGQSATINGNVVVIGAPGAVVGTNQGQGAAYIYQKPPTGWVSMSRANEITASDGVANDNFGISVALRNRTIVVGSIGNSNPGAAYVFGP
ncbi:MAG TPA: FG-GAP repeat protein [Terriglobales bacterium]|jgi:uncharacterized protein (DUF2345 family)